MASGDSAPRRVLVAVGSSKSSKDAVAWALEKLIRTPDDILALLHVLKPIEYVATPGGYVDASQMEPAVVQKIGLQACEGGETLLESFEDMCAPKRIEALTKLVEGDRRKVILEEVERMGATDLVMGGKARRIMPKLNRTSLADYCLKHAPCTVSIIRKGQLIQSSPAKTVPRTPSSASLLTGLVSGTADDLTVAQTAQTPSARPVTEVPALTDSDRARWRSVADVAPAGSADVVERGGDAVVLRRRGERQEHTSPWDAALLGGGQDGREITPGEVDTGSDYMARLIVKARAEELTVALAKLEAEGDLNIYRGELSPSEKAVIAEGEASDERGPGSQAEPGLGTEETVDKSIPPPQTEEIYQEESLREPVEGGGSAMFQTQVADDVASEKSAVSDKEVDPNSLSLGEAPTEGSKPAPLHLTSDVLDSEASLVEHENSFGEFKSESSLDGNIFSMLSVSLVDPVEKAGESDGFIQYKRPDTPEMEPVKSPGETVEVNDKAVEPTDFVQHKQPEAPEYTRGLEVLEVLDRWLVSRQTEDTGRSQSEEDTCLIETNLREAPARSTFEEKVSKTGVMFGWLFRGRGSKDEGIKDKKRAKSPKPEAAPGADVVTAVAAADASVLTPGTTPAAPDVDENGIKRAVEESPPVLLADGGANEPGLLSRIADVIIAEEEEKARQNVVTKVEGGLGGGESDEGKDEGSVASPGNEHVEAPHLSTIDEVMDETGGSTDPGHEMDRSRSAVDVRRMFEEDDPKTQTLDPNSPETETPKPELPPRAEPKKVGMPEGLPPVGRVKVKVQMLNTEARGVALGSDCRVPGVSRRVSRALLEGMVPEMPREDLEEPTVRPESGPQIRDPAAPDTFKDELSKYTLESWLGIGQCVTRFLEDDRSSISSEAYDSVGGSADTGTPASWDGEPADVAPVRAGHVADEWGYGSSRLGPASEEGAREVSGDRLKEGSREGLKDGSREGSGEVSVAETKRSWVKEVVGKFEGEGQSAAVRETVPEPEREVLEPGGGVSAEAQEAPSTSGAAPVESNARRDKDVRSPFSNYWTTDTTTADDTPTFPSTPKLGGFALHAESQPQNADVLAVPVPPRLQTPEASSSRKANRRSERDAYDPRKWAIPLQKEESSFVLRRHPSEAELFGEEDLQEECPAPTAREDNAFNSLSALSISQAITDLASSTFSDLVIDGRISAGQVAAWRDEIAWLTSPADQVTELVASTVETRTGSMKDIIIQRLRADVQTSLPALRSLDDLLQRIILRMNAGTAASKRELMGTREQTIQVLKAALMINEEVLEEMTVPSAYWPTLPKTIKLALGSDLFAALTSKAATPAYLLSVVNPRTRDDAWQVVSKLEAAVQMWRAMMANMAEPLAKKRAVYASRASALVHDLRMTWPTLERTELAEFKITRNTDIGRAILESYSRALISVCGKAVTCLDHLLTLEPPPEKTARRSRSDLTPRPETANPRPKSRSSSSGTLGLSVDSLPKVPSDEMILRQPIDPLPGIEPVVEQPQEKPRSFWGFSRRKSGQK